LIGRTYLITPRVDYLGVEEVIRLLKSGPTEGGPRTELYFLLSDRAEKNLG
jgi:hypothetical protein